MAPRGGGGGRGDVLEAVDLSSRCDQQGLLRAREVVAPQGDNGSGGRGDMLKAGDLSLGCDRQGLLGARERNSILKRERERGLRSLEREDTKEHKGESMS